MQPKTIYINDDPYIGLDLVQEFLPDVWELPEYLGMLSSDGVFYTPVAGDAVKFRSISKLVMGEYNMQEALEVR